MTLDAVVLTRHGWKSYDQVQVGDETVGFDSETGRSEWTPINHVVVKPAQEVVQFGSSRWSARVTPGHRWWAQRRAPVPVGVEDFGVCPECGATSTKRGPFTSARSLRVHRSKTHRVASRSVEYSKVEGFTRTDALTKAHELVLSAPADTGGGLPITLDEARLLGWIAGDGHVHEKRGLHVTLYQSKPMRIAEIRELLVDVPHTEYSRDRGRLPAYQWYIHAASARELLKRAQWWDGPEAFVRSVSAEQRTAWLDGVIAAEGTAVASVGGDVMRIPQNDGPVCEAVILAAYLCGYRPARRRRRAQPGFSMVTLGRPRQHAASFTEAGRTHEPVWCVSTDLGTWTMRQDDQVMLTGNSTSAVAMNIGGT